MDLHVGGLRREASERQLKQFMRGHLQRFGILAFGCKKIDMKKGPTFAILTIPDTPKAMQFMQFWQHQLPPNYRAFYGSMLIVSPGKNKPDPFFLKAMQEEQRKLEKKTVTKANQGPADLQTRHESAFHFTSLGAGIWRYKKEKLGFDEQFKDRRSGAIVFGHASMEIHIMENLGLPSVFRLDIDYTSVEYAALHSSPRGGPTMLTLTLNMPPRIYMVEDAQMLYLANLMNTISLDPELNRLSGPQQQNGKRLRRMCGIDPTHEKIAALCMVYQIALTHWKAGADIQGLFKSNQKMPPLDSFQTTTLDARGHVLEEYEAFCGWLSTYGVYKGITFPVRYQLHSLVLEGDLPPGKVLQLLKGIEERVVKWGEGLVAAAIKKFHVHIPSPSRHIPEDTYSVAELLDMVDEYVSYEREMDPLQELTVRYEHLASVHKATVTPTGVFLRGPDPEVSNRVLRKYAAHSEYFMRVCFADENGMPVQFDGGAVQDEVWNRFRTILSKGLFVAGRMYQFLGFSHSSLRNQTCWFMAEFKDGDGEIVTSEKLIKRIGEFTHIRCPAKCAARIGQAFSDTTTAITIEPEKMMTIPDIQRNERCFSDGCGTISKALLRKVWKKLPQGRFLQPTVLQIRFKGAKGVVSLDSRLSGQILALRESMLKFEAGSTWNDIELCGAGYKPLPCFLNRQFIKILEDLGVPNHVFLNLQAETMEVLKLITQHPINAAYFLEESFIATSSKTPMFIRLLSDIGLSFLKDQFLTDVVEIAAMTKLRDMKYRGRIPVKKGVVLYGIMDETGILEEGQVYVATRKKIDNYHMEDFVLVQDRVAITRAPALHPGDIQIVEAVDVPEDSPLKQLYNCVIFSQKGARDLPSQLSGGDLDGDLFNIIYDEDLVPQFACQPAEYPRQKPLDLGRPVVINDMTEFFIQFMQTDQLGRVSNLHLSLADRQAEGTFDPLCIKLAELASIAVDFSKSGIPVDQSQIPRVNPTKPDFMAPGPRVFMEKKIAIEEAENDEETEEADPVHLLNPGKRRTYYYQSEKVLGHLYRAIDEQKFFQDLRTNTSSAQLLPGEEPLMTTLWKYVQRETITLQWEHHRQFAEELREAYESNLTDIKTSLSPHPRQPLSEIEVFTGNILGKSRGKENKRTREANKDLSERFSRDVAFTVRQITNGDFGEEGGDTEVLPRAVACFAVAMEAPRKGRWWGGVSFRYVVGAVCLGELGRWRGGGLRGV